MSYMSPVASPCVQECVYVWVWIIKRNGGIRERNITNKLILGSIICQHHHTWPPRHARVYTCTCTVYMYVCSGKSLQFTFSVVELGMYTCR